MWKADICGYLKSRNRDTDIENKRMDTKWEGGGGMNWEIGTDIYILLTLCLKIDK